MPCEIEALCRDTNIYDSSSSPEARVYFLDRDGGFYLKTAAKGSLEREAVMADYFYKKGIGSEVLNYFSDRSDILFTRAVRGEDCTAKIYLDSPRRLAKILAERLRALHELDCSDCPVKDRVGEYIALAKTNYTSDNYSKEHFPDSFGFTSGREAYNALVRRGGLLKNEVLIHGDYCLPNIMLDNWSFSGFIDLDHAGIGDRHIDLFWGRWSLGFNLSLCKERDISTYQEYFFDAYGRDKINEEALLAVAAAEVFG